MEGVEQDRLEVLVGCVLGHPVGVKQSQVSALSPDALLCHCAKRSLGGHGVDTLMDGLPVDNALGEHLLAASTADTDSPDREALLCFVAELAGLVRARGASALMHGGELSVLPGAHAEDKAHDIRLLPLPDFFEVLVSAHYNNNNHQLPPLHTRSELREKEQVGMQRRPLYLRAVPFRR